MNIPVLFRWAALTFIGYVAIEWFGILHGMGILVAIYMLMPYVPKGQH